MSIACGSIGLIMKIIIAGSRTLADYSLIHSRMNYLLRDVDTATITIISGTARGVDQLGERFANEQACKLIRMPADWDTHGKSAGYKRNEEMAKIATHAVIFWDGESRGTKHMIKLAKTYKLHTRIYNADNQLI